MKLGGIDGCPGGWLGFTIDHNYCWTYHVCPSIIQLVNTLPADLYFIDMPIGLNEKTPQRQCDVKLRGFLPPKLKASVFSPPVEATLRSKSYEEACKINQSITGKKVSLQVWNIMSKIKELNACLQKNTEMQKLFLESHPETCFLHLNKGLPLINHKRVNAGINERLLILGNLWAGAGHAFAKIKNTYVRKLVKPDDVTDAMVLALSAIFYYPNYYLELTSTEWEQQDGIAQKIAVPQKKLPRKLR